MLKIAVGKGPLLPGDVDVFSQQTERRSTVWYSAQKAILRIGQTRRELWPGNAQHEHITRWTMRGVQGFGQGHKGGVTVPEHNFAPALGDEMQTSRVHHEPDVFGRIATLTRPPEPCA